MLMFFKQRAYCILIFSPTELLLKMKLEIILLLKAKHIFKDIFIMTQLKYFHDSPNFVVILSPGRQFFSTKCVCFPLTFKE